MTAIKIPNVDMGILPASPVKDALYELQDIRQAVVERRLDLPDDFTCSDLAATLDILVSLANEAVRERARTQAMYTGSLTAYSVTFELDNGTTSTVATATVEA